MFIRENEILENTIFMVLAATSSVVDPVPESAPVESAPVGGDGGVGGE